MKKLSLLLFLFLSTLCNAQIVISQYVETSAGSIPKGIEIWNPSGSDIDLSTTPITIFKGTNGAAPALDHTVNTGILKAGNILVVGTSDLALANLANPCTDALYSLKAFTFNGDDALVLYLNGVIQDVIGTPGSDPGASWSGSGVSTADQNIQLKTGITTGDIDGWTDPSERFTNIGGGTTITDFGQPTDGCPTSTTTTINFASTVDQITEDGVSINVCIDITNPSAASATTVDINVGGSSTATNGSDYSSDGLGTMVAFPITITFPANSSAQQCLTVFIEDDSDVEVSENLILNLENPTGGESATLGSQTSTTLTILDNDTNIPTINEIRINELDCNTLGTDNAEFIELFGLANYNMDGLILVLYNGSGDASYNAIDLSGHTLDANGFFIIGGSNAGGNPDISLGNDAIQNGADAVALYVGTPAEFPNGTPVTTVNMIDALVYDTNDADDSGLLTGLNQTEQIDENANNNTDFESIQRGSWFVSAPTPRSTNVLPVKLTQYTVRQSGRSNLISWTTAVEINNEKFEIQHSSNGKDFETIGTVAGHGNSYIEIDYTFFDEKPIRGTNYYRLKQMDFDGSFEYTKILKMENSSFGIDIYPSSASTDLNLTLSEIESATFYISNADGKNISSGVASEGLNVIDISVLSSGLYFISIIANGEIVTRRIFKQ